MNCSWWIYTLQDPLSWIFDPIYVPNHYIWDIFNFITFVKYAAPRKCCGFWILPRDKVSRPHSFSRTCFPPTASGREQGCLNPMSRWFEAAKHLDENLRRSNERRLLHRLGLCFWYVIERSHIFNYTFNNSTPKLAQYTPKLIPSSTHLPPIYIYMSLPVDSFCKMLKVQRHIDYHLVVTAILLGFGWVMFVIENILL